MRREWFNNDNNLNPEISQSLKDRKIDSEEAKALLDILDKNKWKVIQINKNNLSLLRIAIWNNNYLNMNNLITWQNKITQKDISLLKKIEGKKEKKEINNKISSKDIKNIAAMVLAETEWEKEIWKKAVAFVIKNRIKKWNMSTDQVLFSKNQFSPFTDWRFKEKMKQITNADIQLIKDVFNSWEKDDITIWATFFQVNSIKTGWQNLHLHEIKKIGWHTFFRPKNTKD